MEKSLVEIKTEHGALECEVSTIDEKLKFWSNLVKVNSSIKSDSDQFHDIDESIPSLKNDDAKIKQNIKTEKNDIDESVCRLQNMELKDVNEKLERNVTRRKVDDMTGQNMDTQLKNLETKLGRHEDLTDIIKDEILLQM